MVFTHLKLNLTNNFVDPVIGAHTQNIKNSWKNAKSRTWYQFSYGGLAPMQVDVVTEEKERESFR